MDGDIEKMGVFASRFILASSPTEAGNQIILQLEHELRQQLRNIAQDAPRFRISAIVELPWYKRFFPPKLSGFTFFLDDEEENTNE